MDELPGQITITFEFPNGEREVKHVRAGDDKAVYVNILLKAKEAYRDYLYSLYGNDWRAHDAGAGKFWHVGE